MATHTDHEPAGDGDVTGPVIDVPALVDELRVRAAALRASGGVGADLDFGAVPIAGPHRPHVAFRPDLAYSSKPVVGPVITGVKQTTLRMMIHVFNALAADADAAVGALWSRADDADRSIAALRHDGLRIDAEVAERERVQGDVASLAARLAGVEEELRRLQAGPRLARLERAARTAPPPADAATGETGAGQPPAPRMDYERFEGRFRPEEAVHAHQERYAQILAGAGRVVDVGCGRGELVRMLRDRGVDAYGYELEPDFVALAAEQGVPVSLGDGIAHVAGLPPGSVGGVVASHVVEHLPPAEVIRLVEAAADALSPGGILIMETPNPESLVAGSVNFHRDLTHRSPIHPDTLTFLCESAGFDRIEVLRLSPVTEPDLLPEPPAGAADAAFLHDVVGRLNRLLFGFQDYAVVARLP
jgi:SAM-dependent methyltransferase